jgi:xylulokinase
MKLSICIDAGTTRFKAAFVTHRGEVVARSEYYYPSENDVRHEYKTGYFSGALKMTMEKLLHGTDVKAVEALGVTGHGPTLIPVNERGKALYPGVGYLDDRVKKYIKMLADRKTDRITSTMYAPIALFFKEEMPDVYRNTRYFLQTFDYIAYLLTGEFTASSSSAGIKPWDDKALELAGLDAQKFPKIHYMGQRLGTLSASAQKDYGIPSGLPVHAIGVDFAAALAGTNALEKGKSCERSGSSGGINLCWDSPVDDNRLLSYRHFMKGLWNIAGITSMSGKAIEWAHRVFGTTECPPHIREKRTGEIIFFPYLKGERTPLWNPYAKGMFYGLTADHTKEDLVFSVHLGIVFSLRDCMEIIENNGCAYQYPVVTTGWGARNDWFIQLKSNVTGKEFSKLQVEDAELLGIAAILAASSGYYQGLSEAAENIIRTEKIFTPEKGSYQYYSEQYKIYKELQQKLLDFF